MLYAMFLEVLTNVIISTLTVITHFRRDSREVQNVYSLQLYQYEGWLVGKTQEWKGSTERQGHYCKAIDVKVHAKPTNQFAL